MLYTIVDTAWMMQDLSAARKPSASWVSLRYGKLEVSGGKVVSIRSTDLKDYLNKSYYPGAIYAQKTKSSD